ncbi:MAG: GTPase domain-containing protein [Candidatus Kariarchaeaceae archaeon]
MLLRRFLRKIVIIGTTGSGKTTFLQALVGPFKGTEVKRNLSKEQSTEKYFTPIKSDHFKDSTTTVSMNVKPINFIVTNANYFKFFPMDNSGELPIPIEEIDAIFPVVIIDTAGQERFSFMPEIGLKGAHGVIIMADGTNVSSIDQVASYISMVKKQEEVEDRLIPTIVFVNKSDLRDKGIYVGAEILERWLSGQDIETYETSSVDLDSFLLPLRIFLNRIKGLPITMDDIYLKEK